ncbi:hypothetical protein Tco_0407901 [Tanacetum coccineum]
MNPQETEQVIARDELWVPTAERVNISTTNVRLETTVKQKEKTFQVVIDVIKNSTCINAFTISADVPKILMQQFWYTITKIKGSESYEFLLADKRCVIDVEVFRKILNICPRKEGVKTLSSISMDMSKITENSQENRQKRTRDRMSDHEAKENQASTFCSQPQLNHNGNPAEPTSNKLLVGVKASANSDIVYFFTSAQDGDPLQDDVRLCLGDDLKKAQDHNQRQVKDESKDHYPKYWSTLPSLMILGCSVADSLEQRYALAVNCISALALAT